MYPCTLFALKLWTKLEGTSTFKYQGYKTNGFSHVVRVMVPGNSQQLGNLTAIRSAPDLDDDSELNILDTSYVDKAVRSVVRWLRNENTTRDFEEHPVARDAIVIAVREVSHSTALATPTSTPYNPHTSIDQALTHFSPPYIAHEESDPGDQTSTLLLPLHIAQAERGDFNDSTDLHKLSREAPD
ncbi:hypothetical protein V499_00024 [Pseudogymnoascus sp. VKM F-103]|nr:hypothetical protein V499_00024 [Pseudogymnoascus sp. VKM F-103]